MLFTPELAEAVRAAKLGLREEAVKRLAEAFPAGQPGQLDCAERRAVVESAAGALLHALESGDFDLVALGRDAKSALGERVLGSVPANLLLHAVPDMLIVP
jgi:nucleotide-binding universal stress UspA family protein